MKVIKNRSQEEIPLYSNRIILCNNPVSNSLKRQINQIMCNNLTNKIKLIINNSQRVQALLPIPILNPTMIKSKISVP